MRVSPVAAGLLALVCACAASAQQKDKVADVDPRGFSVDRSELMREFAAEPHVALARLQSRAAHYFAEATLSPERVAHLGGVELPDAFASESTETSFWLPISGEETAEVSGRKFHIGLLLRMYPFTRRIAPVIAVAISRSAAMPKDAAGYATVETQLNPIWDGALRLNGIRALPERKGSPSEIVVSFGDFSSLTSNAPHWQFELEIRFGSLPRKSHEGVDVILRAEANVQRTAAFEPDQIRKLKPIPDGVNCCDQWTDPLCAYFEWR